MLSLVPQEEPKGFIQQHKLSTERINVEIELSRRDF